MPSKKNDKIKIWFVNFFGVIAYCVVALQVLLVFLAYFEPVGSLIKLIMPNANPSPEPIVPIDPVIPIQPSEPSIFAAILGFVVVAFMVGLSIYALIKTPSILARGGKKVVDKTAEASAPLIIRVTGKKTTKRRIKLLTPMIKIAVKAVLIVLPLTASLLSFSVEQTRIDYSIIQVSALFLASLAFGLFVIQYLLAKAFAVKKDLVI